MANGESIYENLLEGTLSTKTLAKNWINKFADDPNKCCKDFHSLIFACANIDFEESAEESLAILDSSQDLEDDDLELPIITDQKFCSHLKNFIRHCFESKTFAILDNEAFWDETTKILLKLIQSRMKAHRKTGVIISLSILDALATLAKKQSDSSSDENENENEPDQRRLMLQSYFDGLFETCFHTGYRDSEADIRKMYALQLNSWIQKYPEEFIRTYFLRYVAWMSHSPSVEDRIQSLKTVQIVLANPISDVIQMFAQRQCPILNSQLCSSSIPEICLATECLISVNLNYSALSDEIQFHKISENLFHKSPKVAMSSAQFILANLKKSISCEDTSVLLVRFAEKVVVVDSITEDSVSQKNEFLDGKLLILVDSFFNGVCDEICRIEDFVRILESEDNTTSFKQFTSSFIKAVAHRVFIDEPPEFRNGNRKIADKVNDTEQQVEVTKKLLSSLGPLIISYQRNKVILRNLLDICQFLYSDDDHIFDNKDLETLITSIVSVINSSSQLNDSQLLIKALATLHSKCSAQMNKNIFESTVNRCINEFVSNFSHLMENLEFRVEENAISYFEELIALLKKLSVFYPYFEVPLSSFQGCEFFVTYVYECLKSSMARVTVWFEVIELCLQIMCNHAMSILDKKPETLDGEGAHCLQICLKFFSEYMYFRHASNPRIFFVNSFYSMALLMKRLYEEDFLESFIDSEGRAYIDDSMLFFITQHMVKFQDDASTKVSDYLCVQFCTMLTTVQPVSERMFLKLLDILMNKVDNRSFQCKVMSSLGSLFDQKLPCLFKYLLRFLVISLLRQNTSDIIEKLKVTLAVLAQKMDKVALASEFFDFHCTGISLYTSGKADSKIFMVLKIALCFLSAQAFQALKSFLDRNQDSALLADKNFKAYKQHIVRHCLVNRS